MYDGGGTLKSFPDMLDEISIAFSRAGNSSCDLNATLGRARADIESAWAQHRDKMGSVESDLNKINASLNNINQYIQTMSTSLHVLAETWRRTDAATAAKFFSHT